MKVIDDCRFKLNSVKIIYVEKIMFLQVFNGKKSNNLLIRKRSHLVFTKQIKSSVGVLSHLASF